MPELRRSAVIIKVGSPPFPAALTAHGTFIAKMEHIWRAARRWTAKKEYIVDESYGVVGVAPF
jgi:hypothetical protein